MARSEAHLNADRDGLLGFSGSIVTVRFGSIIYTYGEDGQTVDAKVA